MDTAPTTTRSPLSTNARKEAVRKHANRVASERDAWIARNSAYYDADKRYLQFLVPPGARVLDLGCGTGDLLASLKPSVGLGVDLSPAMIDQARSKHGQSKQGHLSFVVGDAEDGAFLSEIEGPFDYIILSDTIGLLQDIDGTLSHLHSLSTANTRLIIAYYSRFWEPLLWLAQRLNLRMPQPPVNFLADIDFLNLLELAEFEVIRTEARQLIPRHLLGLGTFINRYLAPLPVIRRFCLRTYVVARSRSKQPAQELSTTVIIPCRNERGNIEPAIRRLPRFGKHVEVLYVEGNSSDGTFAECERVRDANPDWDIKVMKQEGKGKGDAVRKGMDEAAGDIVMILDADLTVPPELLPKFYQAIATGKGEFVNGTRLVYPMETEAMRPLNNLANRFFAVVFTFLLNQRFTDTLCGTKVLKLSSYRTIAANRHYFGDFDPFGDFDLLFGAAKASLKIVEVPIHYAARSYGETQISRFRDGLMLLRMVVFAFRKLKAI